MCQKKIRIEKGVNLFWKLRVEVAGVVGSGRVSWGSFNRPSGMTSILTSSIVIPDSVNSMYYDTVRKVQEIVKDHFCPEEYVWERMVKKVGFESQERILY